MAGGRLRFWSKAVGCCIPLQLTRGSLNRSSVICVLASPPCIRRTKKKAYFAFLLHFFCLFIYRYPQAASSKWQAQFLENPLQLKKTNLEIMWYFLKINAILRKKGHRMHLTCFLSSSALVQFFQGPVRQQCSWPVHRGFRWARFCCKIFML